MYEIHKKLIAKGWLHGIEFFNDVEYYPVVFNMCREYNLAMMGNSDIHGIISEAYNKPEYINRPMTLVFAKERSHDSLRKLCLQDALWLVQGYTCRKGRICKTIFLSVLFQSENHITQDEDNIYFEVINKSDIPFYLINGIKDAPAEITLAANSVTRIVVSKKVKSPLVYDVRNILTGEKDVLKIELRY